MKHIQTLLLIVIVMILSGCGQTITNPQPTTDILDTRMSQTSTFIPTIYMLGDSLTAGYQLPLEDSYPMVLQDILSEQGYQLKIVNGGESGDTSSGLLQRLARVTTEAQSGDIAIVAIGANDGLRGSSIDDLYSNLFEIVTDLQGRGINTIVAGMQLPTNLGESYRADFVEVYSRVAQETNSPLIPFLLEGVGGVVELNLRDGIHPNASGQVIIANTVANFLIDQKIIVK